MNSTARPYSYVGTHRQEEEEDTLFVNGIVTVGAV